MIISIDESGIHQQDGKSIIALVYVEVDDQDAVEDLIAEGDKVTARITYRATHRGEFMGIPPTGKQATVTGIQIVRIAGGKIVENWINLDALGMLQQLGVIPAMH